MTLFERKMDGKAASSRMEFRKYEKVIYRELREGLGLAWVWLGTCKTIYHTKRVRELFKNNRVMRALLVQRCSATFPGGGRVNVGLTTLVEAKRWAYVTVTDRD
jgi:hypothetical protein